MTNEELGEILNKHWKWTHHEPGGEKADLSYEDLSVASLQCTDLREANLEGANLYSADLRCANLCGANLKDADLSYAIMRRADLSEADMTGIIATGTDMLGADIQDAKIDLELLNKSFPIACPEYGSFIGWKKCRWGAIVKLEILEDAQRLSAFGRKCRCSAAKVLAIENFDGTDFGKDCATSFNDPTFIYRVGDIVRVSNFDDNRTHECSRGIHFFITRQEAVNYDP